MTTPASPARVEGTLYPVLATLLTLFLQACSLLDNVDRRDTPQWKAAAALLKAQLKKAVEANAHALAEERSDDSQQRVVGTPNQKGGG